MTMFGYTLWAAPETAKSLQIDANHILCRSLADYRTAGNIGGNYIVRFHEKITGFLLAELNIAF